jgi:four helix bundle protein
LQKPSTSIPRGAEDAAIRDGTLRARSRGMAKSSDLRVRSFEFTVDIVRFCRSMLDRDAVLKRLGYQLVDAAGSVGANVEESGAAQSKPDFISKQNIALKEAHESRFWLRVLAAVEPRIASSVQPHLQESTESIAMLTASIRTAKSNPDRGTIRHDQI